MVIMVKMVIMVIMVIIVAIVIMITKVTMVKMVIMVPMDIMVVMIVMVVMVVTVNQALRKKIAYWAEKEKENARDRSVPEGSDNKEELVLHNVEKRALCCSGNELMVC